MNTTPKCNYIVEYKEKFRLKLISTIGMTVIAPISREIIITIFHLELYLH